MRRALRGSNNRAGRAARLLGVAAGALLLLTSCGLGQKPKIGAFDYSGTWRGTVSDEANGAGTALVTLQQDEYVLTGTWHTVMGGDATRQDGGVWTGQLFIGKESDLLDVTLSPAVAGECSYKVTLSRTQDSVGGSYEPAGAATTCTNLTRGTLQLAKQQ